MRCLEHPPPDTETVTRSVASREPLPVTVVIPAYNREVLLRRALASVAAQTPRPPAEVIVVDDCSTDRTAEVAQDMGARVIRHERNRGEGGARNTGIEAASHEWVALLDSDDEWLPWYLDVLWRLRDGHSLVAGSAVDVYADGSRGHRFHGNVGRAPRTLRSPAELVYPGNVIPASGVMVRRDAVLRAGGYRERMPHAADFDLYLRTLEHGSGVLSPDVVVRYHVHAGQVSNDQAAMHRAHSDVVESYADRPWWSRGRLARRQGLQAWDELRSAERRGDWGTALRRAGFILRDPVRLVGVMGIWAIRFRQRRRTAAWSAAGAPTLAVMPGQKMPPAHDGFALVDLRRCGRLRALLRIARRPPSMAATESRLERLMLRALGIALMEDDAPANRPKSPR